MSLIHFPADAPIDEVAGCVRENGYAIVDRLASNETMDQIERDLEPYTRTIGYGTDSFLGKLTKRTGGLIARSPKVRELIMDDLVLGTTGQILSHTTTFQLHLTQVVELHPGSPAQKIHQDELVWDMYPFPPEYDVQCNTLWAMTDYTEEMGATRIVPGSQRLGRGAKFTIEDTLPAVMDRGSVLIYTGKIYHGSGENKSDKIRKALNLTYSVGWVRQEENQYLACPQDLARTLPDDLLKLMGYQCGCFALGYVRDFEDPLAILKDTGDRTIVGFSEITNTAEVAEFLLEGIETFKN